MPELAIYGMSDDLVEVRGAIRAEFGRWGGCKVRITAPDGAYLVIEALFTDDWQMTVVGGSTPNPAWPIRTARRGDYDHPRSYPCRFPESPALVIDAPEGAVVDLDEDVADSRANR